VKTVKNLEVTFCQGIVWDPYLHRAKLVNSRLQGTSKDFVRLAHNCIHNAP